MNGFFKKKTLQLSPLMLIAIVALTVLAPVLASQEIIDSDWNSGTYLKVSAVLYKDTGEIDPNWDYYSVKTTIEDIKYKNDPWRAPVFADIFISLPTWAEEVPSNHEPKAGFRLSQSSVSFGFMGISYTVYIPAYGVSYEDYISGDGYRKTHWYFYGAQGRIAYGFIFTDYTEASVGIRVPQGQKPYAYVWCRAAWYRKYWFGWYHKFAEESIGDVTVDPPGVILPGPPDAPVLPEAPEYLRMRPGRGWEELGD